MAEHIPGVARTLVIASGKGGVGKTTVTVNLALAMALDGARIGLFDADIYGPNVPLMLGVSRRVSGRGMLPIARAGSEPYITPFERYGLKVMSVGLLVAEDETVMPDPHDAGRIVTQTIRDVVWGKLDYLLIDLPPGTGEPQHSLLRTVAVDGAVVVTTPQDLSLLDASRSLGMFRQAGIPIVGAVENMSYLHCPHCGERIEVFHRSARAWAIEDQAVELLGRVPMDIGISRGIGEGHPLLQTTPEAAGSLIFREIAARIRQKL